MLFQSKNLEKQNQLKPILDERIAQRAKQKRLSKVLDEYTQMKNQKSYLAYYLYRISEKIPDKIWLYNVTYLNDKEKETHMEISGFALSEHEVADFMKYLESFSFSQNVRLDEFVLYDRKEIYRKWKIRRNNLVEFKVNMDV